MRADCPPLISLTASPTVLAHARQVNQTRSSGSPTYRLTGRKGSRTAWPPMLVAQDATTTYQGTSIIGWLPRIRPRMMSSV
jgi:hypothetical protein